MHLGNNTVTPMCAAYGLGVATVGWSAGLMLARAVKKPQPMAFALGTALVFALQAMNVTVLPGAASGHMIGGVLLAYWFGSLWGLGAVSLVLAVQSLLFADGGLMTFGLNVLNMGVIPCLIVWPAMKWLTARLKSATGSGTAVEMPMLAVAAWVSVIAAALVCSVEVMSVAGPGKALVGTMVGVHALIGLIEAGFTVASVLVVRALADKSVHPAAGVATVLGLSAVAAVGASPFEDGLEYSLSHLSISGATSSVISAFENAQSSLAAFPDYANYTVVLGTAVLLLLAWGAARLAGDAAPAAIQS